MAADGSIRKHFEAALGLLDAGNWLAANEELEKVPADVRIAPDVLVLRCRILAMAGRWADVELIAQTASMTYRDNFRFYTHWAWALHRQGRTADGLEVVASVAERFPKSGATAYAIACLNGALGRSAEAQHWLVEAFQRHETDALKEKALKQPELACVWQELRKEQATGE